MTTIHVRLPQSFARPSARRAAFTSLLPVGCVLMLIGSLKASEPYSEQDGQPSRIGTSSSITTTDAEDPSASTNFGQGVKIRLLPPIAKQPTAQSAGKATSSTEEPHTWPYRPARLIRRLPRKPGVMEWQLAELLLYRQPTQSTSDGLASDANSKLIPQQPEESPARASVPAKLVAQGEQGGLTLLGSGSTKEAPSVAIKINPQPKESVTAVGQSDSGSTTETSDAANLDSGTLSLSTSGSAKQKPSWQSSPASSPARDPKPLDSRAMIEDLSKDSQQFPSPLGMRANGKRNLDNDGYSQAKIDEPKQTSANDNSLTVESMNLVQQENPSRKPSPKGDDSECPGAPDGEPKSQPLQPDDLPLEEQRAPYDAPRAESERSEKRLEPTQRQPSFTREELQLRNGIDRCLQYFLTHPENTSRRGPWALMHAALPFGVETEIIAGRRRVNAIGWMCYNGVCARQRMFQPTRKGFRTNVGPGVQGHEGQFLAILAQSHVSADYPIRIGRRNYSIEDLVRYEMATCRERSELTFKLIGLSYYLDPAARWRDNRGRTWNLEKMVAEELAQPVVGAACGGTHRLMGLSYSLIKRREAGLPITGHWKRSEIFLNDFVNYAMTLQNPDGSFSTEWFEGRGNEPDVKRKVQTTGHILEWLIYVLPEEQLRSQEIKRSVAYLLQTVGRRPDYDWPIGPRGHALRALALYHQRVFGAQPGKISDFINQHGSTQSNYTSFKGNRP